MRKKYEVDSLEEYLGCWIDENFPDSRCSSTLECEILLKGDGTFEIHHTTEYEGVPSLIHSGETI